MLIVPQLSDSELEQRESETWGEGLQDKAHMGEPVL